MTRWTPANHGFDGAILGTTYRTFLEFFSTDRPIEIEFETDEAPPYARPWVMVRTVKMAMPPAADGPISGWTEITDWLTRQDFEELEAEITEAIFDGRREFAA